MKFEAVPSIYGGFGHCTSRASRRAFAQITAWLRCVRSTAERARRGRIVRTIGIVRARAKIGLQNLAYNIRHLVTLERLAAA